MASEKDTDKLRSLIAGRLRTARETSGLTQSQVAEKLGLHRPAISEIEAGRRKISAEELRTLAHLYGIDAEWLIGTNRRDSSEPDKILIAARQLSKLKDRDLDRLLGLIQMLRGSGGNQ